MQQVKRQTSQPNKSHLLHPITTVAMDELTSELNFPGFRFHPTEEELLDFYLKKMALGKNMRLDIIGFLNIYRHDPWDLPGLAKIGEREWYFFVPRDKRHGSGGRPNRTTENGFWKATGSDRKIFGLSNPKRQLGLKKTLVFYKGRAPRGTKTDWVMNEYRLLDSCPLPKDIVLCKIYRKATSLKVLEQRAAMEEEITKSIHHHNDHHHAHTPPSPILPPMDTMSFSSHNYDRVLPDPPPMTTIHVASITKAIHHHHHHDHAHNPPSPITPTDTMSFSSQNYDDLLTPEQPMTTSHVASITKEEDQDQDQDFEVTVEEKLKEEAEESDGSITINTIGLGPSLKLPGEMENLGGLQVQLPKFNMDWTQDSFWTQLRSPWLDNLSLTPYANILNF